MRLIRLYEMNDIQADNPDSPTKIGGIQVEILVAIFLLLCALWVISDLNMPDLLFKKTIFGVYLV